MRMVLIPDGAPLETSASLWPDGGGAAALDLDLETEEQEKAFDSWLDDVLRGEGVDLGVLTFGQIRTERKRRLHQFISESPDLWYLLPNREIDRLLQEREALLDRARESSGAATLIATGGDFPFGFAYVDLHIELDRFEFVVSEMLEQPELDGWHRRRLEGLQREAQAIQDGPFGQLLDVKRIRRVGPHQAETQYLAVRRRLVELFRRAKALAIELRCAPTARLRRLGRELIKVSRGRCLRRVDRAMAGDRSPAHYAAYLAAAPDPATTAPILSNAPPTQRLGPARTLAPV